MTDKTEKQDAEDPVSRTDTQKNENSGRRRVAARTSGVSVATVLILSVFKIIAGSIAGSAAVVSDGIHSAADAVNSLIAFFGVYISGRPTDRSHPYGHERYECVISIIMAVILCASGIAAGIEGIERLVEIAGGNGESFSSPGIIAIIAAAVSIVANELLFHYIRAAAKQIHSSALQADAWHHRLDALVSVGSLIGVLGASLGAPILDPLASLVICVLIIRTAVKIFLDAVSKMTDRACDQQTVEEMTETVRQVEGVEEIDALRTRLFGPRIYVDVEIRVNGEEKLKDAHAIAENVERAVEQGYPQVKRCMVYMNPAQ